MARERIDPVAWRSVFLAAVPGLLLALTRWQVPVLGTVLAVAGVIYLVELVVGVPLSWRRWRLFPVWALPVVGMLVWLVIYAAAMGLGTVTGRFDPLGSGYLLIVVLNLLLAVVLYAVLLRRQRVPPAAWLLMALILLPSLLGALLIDPAAIGRPAGFRFEYVLGALFSPVEALMLVAVGLLFARRHGVRALLVVVGGYAYFFTDSDYTFPAADHSWEGLTVYLSLMALLFLVLLPVAFLRARTRMQQAVAIFAPALAYATGRLLAPLLVIGEGFNPWPGDVLLSVNLVLALGLGWMLYSGATGSLHEGLPSEGDLAAAAEAPG